MKIRVKVFLIVAVVFGLLFYGTSKIITKIETANFEKLEKQAVFENISRVQLALEGKFDDLSVKLSDWSRWDDTYAFAQDKNAEYISSNLPNETLTQLRLNFIVIKNEAGETVFQKYISHGEPSPFPKDIEKIFDDPTIAQATKGDKLKKMAGIVNTTEGPFVLGVQSITTSDGTAPPRGLIAFGYAVDGDFVSAMSKATVLKLDYKNFADGENQNLFAEAKRKLSPESRTYIEETPKRDIISGFVLVSDIFSKPAGIFEAQVPRDIYKLGQENMRRLNLYLVGIGVFEIVLILSLFEIFVLRKISKLAEGVQKVTSKENKAQRLEVEGSDEFSELDEEINSMLDAIEQSKAEKKESESRFLNVANSAPVMIWVADETGRIIYVNSALTTFLGKSENELFGDKWTQIIHAEDKEKVLEQYNAASAKHEPLTIKYRVKRANGEFSMIEVNAVTRMTAQGVFKGYIGTAIEVNT